MKLADIEVGGRYALSVKDVFVHSWDMHRLEYTHAEVEVIDVQGGEVKVKLIDPRRPVMTRTGRDVATVSPRKIRSTWAEELTRRQAKNAAERSREQFEAFLSDRLVGEVYSNGRTISCHVRLDDLLSLYGDHPTPPLGRTDCFLVRSRDEFDMLLALVDETTEMMVEGSFSRGMTVSGPRAPDLPDPRVTLTALQACTMVQLMIPYTDAAWMLTDTQDLIEALGI